MDSRVTNVRSDQEDQEKKIDARASDSSCDARLHAPKSHTTVFDIHQEHGTMPTLKTSPVPGCRWRWRERAEEIISLYLDETGQTANGAVISLPVLKNHFRDRLSENDAELMMRFLSRKSCKRWQDSYRDKYVFTPLHRWKTPQEYRIEKRISPWSKSRRGDQGA